LNSSSSSRLFSLVKNLKWISAKQRCQILAIDNGIEYLEPCFPQHASYFHLPVRGEVIYVNLHVVALCLYFLINRGKLGLGLRGVYIAALSKVLKPRVIVTMIDNNNWDTNLFSAIGVPIVYTANGLRHPSHFFGKRFFCYFAMNTALTDPALSFNNYFEEIYPVGHIKMGLFFERYRDWNFTSVESSEPTLLWISQYRDAIYSGSKAMSREQKDIELEGIAHLSRYASDNHYQQRVAIASLRKKMDLEAELGYFMAATNEQIKYSESYADDWNSYEEVRLADLIVGMFSTLLFESLSIGKRVLFVLPDKHHNLKQYISESIRLDLLEPLVISSVDFSDFSDKCNEILSMTDEEYLALIKPFKEQIACFDKETLPHHHVRNRLSQLIQM
jgi:surface carbohydrate biosynthesis protein